MLGLRLPCDGAYRLRRDWHWRFEQCRMHLGVFGLSGVPNVQRKARCRRAAIGHHRLPFQDKARAAVLGNLLQDRVDFAAIGAIKIAKNQYAARSVGGANDGVGGVEIDGFGLARSQLRELLLKNFRTPRGFSL